MSSTAGKPKGRFKRGEAAPKMQKVARQIIRKKGVAGLSFRALADELQLSHSAPLHHFGTIAGLLGAVADEAFSELAGELEEERESHKASKETLSRLAVRYATWARNNSNLYKAIHSPDLWDAVQARRAPVMGRQNPPGRLARGRAKPYVEKATGARELAFKEFLLAAESDLARMNKGTPAPKPVDVARMVTTLVDGYLFQLFNEFGLSDPPPDEVKKMVQLALSGVRAKA